MVRFTLVEKMRCFTLCVMLAVLALSVENARAGVTAASPETSDATEPKTLHDAVASMGRIYGFDVVGLDRLGTEAPDWPPTEQPPAAVLKRLLGNYGYVAELKPGRDATDDRLPQRLLVVGPATDRGDGVTAAGNPMPAGLKRDAAVKAGGPPSALTRSLGQLAMSGTAGGNQGLAPPTAGASAHVTALSGPGASPASSAPANNGLPDMAALTSTARANLIGLVTNLQNACKGKTC